MRLNCPLEPLASAFYSACHVDLSDIEYETADWSVHNSKRDINVPLSSLPRIKARRRPTSYDVEVYAMFPQTWGSTALGFGGIGGAAMTPAYTVIISRIREYCVYFDGRFAYRINNPNNIFYENVNNRIMVPVRNHEIYLKETP